MMILPSGVRQISVPRHQIVTISLLDSPILKDCSLANSIVKDGCDMHVLDLVVVLEWSGSHFNSSNKDVLESSASPVVSDGIKQSSKVDIRLHVESPIPLSVFGSKRYHTLLRFHAYCTMSFSPLCRERFDASLGQPTFFLPCPTLNFRTSTSLNYDFSFTVYQSLSEAHSGIFNPSTT